MLISNRNRTLDYTSVVGSVLRLTTLRLTVVLSLALTEISTLLITFDLCYKVVGAALIPGICVSFGKEFQETTRLLTMCS